MKPLPERQVLRSQQCLSHAESTIVAIEVPEVIEDQHVTSLPIESSNLNLIYASRLKEKMDRPLTILVTSGSDSSISKLWRIFIQLEIEGKLFHEELEPEANLIYTFHWNG